jgi:flagellin-like protein
MKAILKRSPEAVSPVVAEILLVAITVVLAAVIYLMASGMLNSNPRLTPVVAFTGIHGYTGGSYNTSFSVADASQSLGIVQYKFNLRVGSNIGTAMPFAPTGMAANLTVNGTVYQVIWRDTDGGGSLTQGDTIWVTGRGVSLPRATTFDFLLFTAEGQQVTHEPWTTP